MNDEIKQQLGELKKRIDGKEPILGKDFKKLMFDLTPVPEEQNTIRKAVANIPDDKPINSKARRQLKKFIKFQIWRLKFKL